MDIEKLISGGAVGAVIIVVLIFIRHLDSGRKSERERDKLFTDALEKVSDNNTKAAESIRQPLVEMKEDMRELTVHMRRFTGQVETHFPRKRQT